MSQSQEQNQFEGVVTFKWIVQSYLAEQEKSADSTVVKLAKCCSLAIINPHAPATDQHGLWEILAHICMFGYQEEISLIPGNLQQATRIIHALMQQLQRKQVELEKLEACKDAWIEDRDNLMKDTMELRRKLEGTGETTIS